MEEKNTVASAYPPAYIMSPVTTQTAGSSRKTKALFGYAMAITTALVVVLIVGGVYYYNSLEVLQDAIKSYHSVDKSGDTPTDQNVEIDTDKNVLVYRLNGKGITPGTFAVQDYSKSITGIYDPKSLKCYLMGGIKQDVVDPKTYSDMLEKNSTLPAPLETLNYQIADNYPVSDKSVLPSALKKACTYLPVYWLEPGKERKDGIQKRCVWYRACWRDCCYLYCYYFCS